MGIDRSEGWDAVADRFLSVRSDIGASLVRGWATANLSPSSSILDVGCGSGLPIAKVLIEDGFNLCGIDASPRLVAAFRGSFPTVPVCCEAAQDSAMFGRTFAGVVAIGLLFMLRADDQRTVIHRVANALKPGGRFLFSAPQAACEWQDALTGRTSRSLGEEAYERCLRASGLRLVGCDVDEGGNHYFDAAKPL